MSRHQTAQLILGVDGITDYALAIDYYIEALYDPHRRHSALGYPSPAESERRYRPAETTAA